MFTWRKRIYLDYGAATPVRKEVLAAMFPYWMDEPGNASSIHKEGIAAAIAIEEARETLARTLHTRSNGIVFTGSGTESNNLALLGVVQARHAEGVAYTDMEVVSTKLEHASILETLKHLELLGVHVKYVAVDESGRINQGDLVRILTPHTVLVTFSYVNSEIGVIQHASKISKLVHEAAEKWGTTAVVHTDASQASLWLSCEIDRLGVDIMTLDAGKCYGPKGVGVLAYKHGVTLVPHIYGGGQENGMRPGTENTPLIIGAVKALCIAQEGIEKRAKHTQALRDSFIQELLTIEGAVLNGSEDDRVANNVNISIPGIDAEFAVITLDQQGIACSTKSACGGSKGDGSSVVRILTGDDARARSTIRFTLGEKTTEAELAHTVAVLKEHVLKMRKFKNGL